MKRSRLVAALAAAGTAIVPLVFIAGSPAAQARAFDPSHMPKIQHRLMSGALALVVDAGDNRNADAQYTRTPRNYYPADTNGCPVGRGNNVKVNQNCLNLTDPDLQGRGQSQNETSIAHDPRNAQSMVASYNDYRRGDGNCYTAYSRNGGRTWADTTVPMSFTRGTAFGNALRHYWQAGGDTSVAFDTRGNAYLSCQVFNRGTGASDNPDVSSAFYVFRSTHNGGASWNFPGRPVAEEANATQNPSILLDKQLLTVDNHVSSPYRDRVYVTYTSFASNGTAYIYSSYSSDYGEHFSKAVLVSKDSGLCANTYGLPTPRGRCNENQFSQPFTGPDGSLYVAWANFNNSVSGKDNRNQMLLARSTDGGRSFSSPVKVSDYYDLPDCATYQNGQDLGRACVPEKGKTANSIFRATNYPSGSVNPTNPRQVVVTFGSYLNTHSNESNGCRPQGFSPDTGINLYLGVKTAGACNNDVLISTSTNGGRSFSGASVGPRQAPVVTTAPGQQVSDQWSQWASFAPNGRLAVGYYDRQYGTDEKTGYSDFSVSGSNNLRSYRVTRASSSSTPPPTTFGGVFWGDYTGITASELGAFPLWTDSRDPDLFLCPDTGTTGVPPRLCTASAAPPQTGLRAHDDNAYTARVGAFSP